VRRGELERAVVVAGDQRVGRRRRLATRARPRCRPRPRCRRAGTCRSCRPFELADLVAGEQDRDAVLCQLADERRDRAGAGRVEPAGRLVEQQQPRRAQQRGGDPEALAHPGRVAARGDPRHGRRGSTRSSASSISPRRRRRRRRAAPAGAGSRGRSGTGRSRAPRRSRRRRARALVPSCSSGRPSSSTEPRRGGSARTGSAGASSCRRRSGRATANLAGLDRHLDAVERHRRSNRLTSPVDRTAATAAHYTGGVRGYSSTGCEAQTTPADRIVHRTGYNSVTTPAQLRGESRSKLRARHVSRRLLVSHHLVETRQGAETRTRGRDRRVLAAVRRLVVGARPPPSAASTRSPTSRSAQTTPMASCCPPTSGSRRSARGSSTPRAGSPRARSARTGSTSRRSAGTSSPAT
jgi:hypothetical protein